MVSDGERLPRPHKSGDRESAAPPENRPDLLSAAWPAALLWVAAVPALTPGLAGGSTPMSSAAAATEVANCRSVPQTLGPRTRYCPCCSGRAELRLLDQRAGS